MGMGTNHFATPGESQGVACMYHVYIYVINDPYNYGDTSTSAKRTLAPNVHNLVHRPRPSGTHPHPPVVFFGAGNVLIYDVPT